MLYLQKCEELGLMPVSQGLHTQCTERCSYASGPVPKLPLAKSHVGLSQVSHGSLVMHQILKYLHMEELHITHYGLGVRGVTALAAALKVNENLHILRLAGNHLGGEGVRLISEALHDNRTVKVCPPYC
eukprot:1474574-Pyramimonas_sp.AAC.1